MPKELSAFDIELQKELCRIIEKNWGSMMSSICTNESKNYDDIIFSPEDLKQDCFEYILRYTYNETKRRYIAMRKGLNDDKGIWITYLGRTMYYCFLNLRRSTKAWHRRMNIVNNDIIDYLDKNKYQIDDPFDLEAEMELDDYIDYVTSFLNYQELQVFYTLINPPKEFTKFLQEKKIGKVFKSVVAEYFGVKYAKMFAIFKKFQEVFAYCDSTL